MFKRLAWAMGHAGAMRRQRPVKANLSGRRAAAVPACSG